MSDTAARWERFKETFRQLCRERADGVAMRSLLLTQTRFKSAKDIEIALNQLRGDGTYQGYLAEAEAFLEKGDQLLTYLEIQAFLARNPLAKFDN
jgi:hypothetical protein